MEPWTERSLVLLRAFYADSAATSSMMIALYRDEHELFPGIAAAILQDASGSRAELQRLCFLYGLGPIEIAVMLNAQAPPDATEIISELLGNGISPLRRVLKQSRPLAAFEAQLRRAGIAATAAQLAEAWRILAECEMIAGGVGPIDDEFDLIAHRWRLSDVSRAMVACRLYPEHRERRRELTDGWIAAMSRKRGSEETEGGGKRPA